MKTRASTISVHAQATHLARILRATTGATYRLCRERAYATIESEGE